MPHVIVEYSNNVIETEDLPQLLRQINQLLADNLPAELNSCKSRAYRSDIFCLGDGADEQAFVHVDIKIMPGRSAEKIQMVGQELLSFLNDYFTDTKKTFATQITLHISELITYFK